MQKTIHRQVPTNLVAREQESNINRDQKQKEESKRRTRSKKPEIRNIKLTVTRSKRAEAKGWSKAGKQAQ